MNLLPSFGELPVDSIIGIGGLAAACLSLLFAWRQAIRVRELRARRCGDLLETINFNRALIRELQRGELRASKATSNLLMIHLLKELVQQERDCTHRTLSSWVATGRLTSSELRMAQPFLMTRSDGRTSFNPKRLLSTLRTDEAKWSHDLPNSGLQRIYKHFPQQLVSEGIAKSTQSVKILTTWSHTAFDLSAALKVAAGAGAKIHFILLEPNSTFADQRAKDLGHEPIFASSQIERCIDWIRNTFAESGIADSWKIYYNTMMPNVIIYLFDDGLVYCPLLHGNELALNRPQFHVTRDSDLYTLLNEQFDIVLENAIIAYPEHHRDNE